VQIRQDFSKNLINVLPGAVDPPVDRGVRAVAGQPEPAECAPAAALSPAATSTIKAAGKIPPPPSIPNF
jgi:hypothetical protein